MNEFAKDIEKQIREELRSRGMYSRILTVHDRFNQRNFVISLGFFNKWIHEIRTHEEGNFEYAVIHQKGVKKVHAYTYRTNVSSQYMAITEIVDRMLETYYHSRVAQYKLNTGKDYLSTHSIFLLFPRLIHPKDILALALNALCKLDKLVNPRRLLTFKMYPLMKRRKKTTKVYEEKKINGSNDGVNTTAQTTMDGVRL